MYTIKFSHRYTKMPVAGTALLLQIIKTHFGQLSNTFIAYDTEIYNTHEHFEIPKTDVMILLLMSPMGHVWTTVRRWTPRKEEFYKTLVGKVVGIDIPKEEL